MRTTEQGHSDSSTTMILTEAGSSYFFRRNQRLQRFRLIDGREDYGLQLQDYNPKTLDKLISQGMVRKLEFPVHAIRSDRQMLMQYVTSVTLGFLTHAARIQLAQAVESSPLLRFARRFPERWQSESHDSASERTLRRELINLTTRQVLERAHSQRSHAYEDDPFKPLVGRFLTTVPESAWHLLAVMPDDAPRRSLIEDITETISRFVLQASVADYLSLVWAELIGHLQNARQADPVPVVHLLSQLDGVGFDTQGLQGRASHRLHMMAGTGDIQFAALKADLEEIVTHMDGGTQTFEQFYRVADTAGDDLALYYLGFLEESCRRVGLQLRAFVRGGSSDGILNIVVTTGSKPVGGTQ